MQEMILVLRVLRAIIIKNGKNVTIERIVRVQREQEWGSFNFAEDKDMV